MRLIPAPWANRLAGVGVIVLGVIALESIISTTTNTFAVLQAGDRLEAGQTTAADVDAPEWVAPVPLMQIGDGDPKALLGERLATEIRNAGLATTSIEVASLRPLGGGLRLAEVRIEATGEAAAVLALANWVAVNRATVRMETLESRVADGPSVHQFTWLVVIA